MGQNQRSSTSFTGRRDEAAASRRPSRYPGSRRAPRPSPSTTAVPKNFGPGSRLPERPADDVINHDRAGDRRTGPSAAAAGRACVAHAGEPAAAAAGPTAPAFANSAERRDLAAQPRMRAGRSRPGTHKAGGLGGAGSRDARAAGPAREREAR